jgi:hypothetical protein
MVFSQILELHMLGILPDCMYRMRVSVQMHALESMVDREINYRTCVFPQRNERSLLNYVSSLLNIIDRSESTFIFLTELKELIW